MSPQSLDRRAFLRAAGVAGVAPWLASAARQTDAEGERILVVIMLDGGNDGLSTLVPLEDDRYWRARPTIAGKRDALRTIAPGAALHASLPHLARRFAEGRVAFVQGVGSPRSNLSHFASKDTWDSGSLSSPPAVDGWLGRAYMLLDAARGARVPLLAVGADAMPYALREASGSACVLPSLEAYTIADAPPAADDEAARARRRALERMHAHRGDSRTPLAAAYRTARLSVAELARVESARAHGEYPPTKLAEKLRLVSRVIAAGLSTRVFHVVQNGYDTHTDQVAIQGSLLAELDGALEAFTTDLAAQGALERVLVLAVSEFGRRVAESGIGEHAGTDHGDASTLFLCGSKVAGGIHGAAPDLEHLDESGNWRTVIDFRRLYADVLRDWLDVDPAIVLGRKFEPLGVFA